MGSCSVPALAAIELALITCEHGGCRIPPPYGALFRGQAALLRSHRGFDAGALDAARALARALGAPLVASTTSRLLVDLNRSPDNPAVFSTITRRLDSEGRRKILRQHHAPHRRRAERILQACVRQGTRSRARQLHVAVHSFVPVWRGRRRSVDIGLLYDPARRHETRLVRQWRHRLQQLQPTLRVHLNRPYRGWTDGLPTALRRSLGSRYVGVELELNQRLLVRRGRFPRQLLRDITSSLQQILQEDLAD